MTHTLEKHLVRWTIKVMGQEKVVDLIIHPEPVEGKPRCVAFVQDRDYTNLLSAAPDLLAACEDALESLNRLPNVNGAFRVTCIAELKSAIAKAKGA